MKIKITRKWFERDHPNPLHVPGIRIDPKEEIVEYQGKQYRIGDLVSIPEKEFTKDVVNFLFENWKDDRNQDLRIAITLLFLAEALDRASQWMRPGMRILMKTVVVAMRSTAERVLDE